MKTTRDAYANSSSPLLEVKNISGSGLIRTIVSSSSPEKVEISTKSDGELKLYNGSSFTDYGNFSGNSLSFNVETSSEINSITFNTSGYVRAHVTQNPFEVNRYNSLDTGNFSTQMAAGFKLLSPTSAIQLGPEGYSTTYSNKNIVFNNPDDGQILTLTFDEASGAGTRAITFPKTSGKLALQSEVGFIKKSDNTVSYTAGSIELDISTIETDTSQLGFHINSYDDSDNSAIVQFTTDTGDTTVEIYGTTSSSVPGVEFTHTIGELTYFFLKAHGSYSLYCAAIFRSATPNKSLLKICRSSRAGAAYATNTFLNTLSATGRTIDSYMASKFTGYTLLKTTKVSYSKFDDTSKILIYYPISGSASSSGTVQISTLMQRLNLYCF